jgi:hypothetical protein
MARVKRTHKFDESNESGNVGHMLLYSLSNTHLISGDVNITEGGGDEDKNKKIDAYIETYQENSEDLKKNSLQIKLDYQHAISGSVALELAEMNFWGGRLCNVRDGNLLQKELMDVDYLVYILPGRGIYFWNPRDLNRLTWYLLTNYIQEESWDEVHNTFRLVVANNQEWLSINYLVPYHMIDEPNYFRTDYDWELKKWNATNIPVGPLKVIEWTEALRKAQENEPEVYEKMMVSVIKYANYYGKYKRDKILESWGIDSTQI